MDINPRTLYTIKQIAKLLHLSVNQVHQAKYDEKIRVQKIDHEVEQVLGNDAITFAKSEYYESRSKIKEYENIVVDEHSTDICNIPTQTALDNDGVIKPKFIGVVREICSVVGDRDVTINFHIHYHGREDTI